jgi:hypothetical protein
VGDSRTSYLSRKPQRTSQSTPTTTRRSIRGAAQGGLLDLPRSACNQAVARLHPSRVPAPESPPSKPLDLAPRGEVASLPDADFSQVPVHTDSDTTPRSAPSRLQWPISAAPSRSLSNQALPRLMAGAATPPVVIPHSHPDESAAQALAHAVMRMNVPGGQRAADRATRSDGLDSGTRAFFESRFDADLGDVRVHANPVAAQSAAWLGASAYTVGTNIVMGAGRQAGPNMVTAHELAHVVRGDAIGRLCRANGGSGSFTIISQVWRVADRDIVMVATGYGNQVLSFYRRTGKGFKGVGIAPEAQKWVPFKTLMEHPDPIYAGEAYFNKNPYYTTVGPENKLRGYGNTRNQEVGAWLDERQIPAGTEAESWERVEQEMDQVAARYRASTPGGGAPGGGSGPGGSAEPKASSADAKGVGTEAKATGTEAKAAGTEMKTVGTEAKSLGAEAKALRGEGTALEVAMDAAKAGRVARISALLADLFLPGPLDVFFMFLSAFGSIAEAKAKLKADAYALGFAEGLAAALTGTPASETTRLLMFTVATPGMGERVAGFEGVSERGNNEGVAAGFKFGHALNTKQRQGFLVKAGYYKLVKAGYYKIGDQVGRNDMIDMGVALRPTVIELLEEAARQEAERKDYERRMSKDWYGHNV